MGATTMLDRNDYLTLTEAAEVASATPEAVRLWLESGRIASGSDPEVLAMLNQDRRRGRPNEMYVLRADVERVASERNATEVTPDMILVADVRKALLVSVRSVTRIRRRHGLTELRGPDNRMYLLRSELAKLRPGTDYLTSASPAQIDEAARRHGLR